MEFSLFFFFLVSFVNFKPPDGLQYNQEMMGFSTDLILQHHHGPGVDSASNKNEYQKPSWE
jgi:hypothetical protein